MTDNQAPPARDDQAERLQKDYEELMRQWQPPAPVSVLREWSPRRLGPRVVESFVTYSTYEDPI